MYEPINLPLWLVSLGTWLQLRMSIYFVYYCERASRITDCRGDNVQGDLPVAGLRKTGCVQGLACMLQVYPDLSGRCVPCNRSGR